MLDVLKIASLLVLPLAPDAPSHAPEVPSVLDVAFAPSAAPEGPCYVCGTSNDERRVGPACRAQYNVTSDAPARVL